MTIPVTDELPISLRAYAVRADNRSGPSRSHKRSEIEASEWHLIFDCETRVDPAQSLRFGAYQIRQSGALMEQGLFYAPENVTRAELAQIRSYADENHLECLTQTEFVEAILFTIGYDYRGTIVGFNLPFDISRIAIKSSSARGKMKGGFSFTLSEDKRRPNLQVKHISAKAAFIQFAAPMKSRTNRSRVKLGKREPIQRGHFIDCKTLANALLARSFSLASLCEALGVENSKIEYSDFEAPISDDFIGYALRDVQATWECYCELIERFDQLALAGTSPEKIYSEASLGKACLKAMGVKPWRECQPDFDPAIIGKVMSAYYGGRSEVHIRREERQVMLCDFLSMYPTVCTLMGLWSFVTSEGVEVHDATEKAKAILLGDILSELRCTQFWRGLTILVRVIPVGDIFPVRAKYADAQQATIGLNYLTNERGQWFTLADCLASTLLSGKPPNVIEAIEFRQSGTQAKLSGFDVGGNAAYSIHPKRDDFYKRLIELRQDTKAKLEQAKPDERAMLGIRQHALKIMANATSYGIFVEMNVENAKADERVDVFAGDEHAFASFPSKIEEPGTFFHPLLATLITGAARLMLAITEKLAIERGLEWAFCDTDSMALAKPRRMGEERFQSAVQEIIDWFGALNPYDFEGSILKSEGVNFATDSSGRHEQLYCLAISAKRYALYNRGDDEMPIIRKASAHGLGHLRAPYDERNPSRSIPKPKAKFAEMGISLWQHDLWFNIIGAIRSERPELVDFGFHPSLQLPAISRYAATSPTVLRWFNHFNEDKNYSDQVKPFGFLTALFATSIEVGATSGIEGQKRKAKKVSCAPISPFETDPAKAANQAFDRETGDFVPIEKLKTFAQAMAQYHLQPENKFLNGNFRDSGETERRHICAVSAVHIGKEANDLERQASIGFDPSAQPLYGLHPDQTAELQGELKRLCEVFSTYQISTYAGITAKKLSDFLNADCTSQQARHEASELEKITRYFRRKERRECEQLEKLEKLIADSGLRKAARKLCVDPSNLRRNILKRRSCITKADNPATSRLQLPLHREDS
ncbi:MULTISPECIES: DNA polymerase domain-containing protein [Citromicrobium]|uniref:DNA polymerase domain-containing protein n=1 Tax=Citromicrobium TaxID=72173 RepID=UPI0001DD110E|nr:MULTISPECIES: DNA polymerase domain-containing protein [Citromicrobium]ALG60760.1 hypothetical protein WG74_07930 [Citromicrobium sp. JL477]